jgi:acetoin utilization deacetylase AcuC-like enzyme
LIALDADTSVVAGSIAAALRAAGGAVAAVDAVATGRVEAAFVATRPPGHHAEAAQAMGFCLFSNAAIAALRARERFDRVAVVDFDVHHGNGTAAILAGRPGLFYASSHQYPCYPGTGGALAVRADGVDVPLPPGTKSAAFRAAYREILLPALDRFAPELLIISAGFDAHQADPLAQLELETGDFVWITGQLQALADRHAGGRIVSLLEGGYNLAALAESAAAHVRTLLRIVN